MNITKVPVEKMLNLLGTLYSKGVDYVDFIITSVNDTECELLISYKKEYISEEFKKNFEDQPDTNVIDVNKPISDEDINKLI